ncbi:MAG TPA: outer membrane beta-barrel protein [Chitinophagaceae bacterium]|nr:outer membrane beta-barrel protein [Chitinophagaceae bacterium]
MKRILIALVFISIGTAAIAQDAEKPTKKKWDLSKRSADHFMIQFGYHNWSGQPDSIKPSGFSRTFNMYFLFDFPFKSNPKLSIAIGPGMGTDNIFFEKTNIDLKNRKEIEFNKDSVTQYKKYKLQTGYLEVPVEFRYSSNPANMNSGFKAALGVKVGTILDAKTKAKVDKDAQGDGGYVYKVKDKNFFNSYRMVATLRLGYGNFTAFGTYTLSEVFKEGQGPLGIRPWSVGLTLSGL